MKLEGIITALVTPIKEGNVDRPAMDRLVDYVLAEGCDGLLVLGGTGEYCSLTPEQRAHAVEACVEKAAGAVPVIAGVLSPGLHDAVTAATEYKNLGADAAMLVTPYYHIAGQQGLVNHYLAFMDRVDLPLVLYNIPYRTLVNMQPETAAEIVEKSDGRVVGMKASEVDLGQVCRLISLVGDKINVLCGDETLFCTEMLMGAKGGILASPNIIPRFWRKMVDLIRQGDNETAMGMQRDIQPFVDLMFGESNPGPLKAALKHAGLDCGDALLPLQAPGKEYAEKIAQGMTRFKQWWK